LNNRSLVRMGGYFFSHKKTCPMKSQTSSGRSLFVKRDQ
jgi:hypothetical protein